MPPSFLPPDPSQAKLSYDTGGDWGTWKIQTLFTTFRFISLALSFGSLAGILAIVKLTEAQLLTKAA